VTGPTESESSSQVSAAPAPDPGPLLVKGAIRKLEVSKGDVVRLRVRASSADDVHVHGYDLLRAVKPGKTTVLRFTADIEGIFEIELEGSGTRIGELRVQP
jgi:hypothetical protein